MLILLIFLAFWDYWAHILYVIIKVKLKHATWVKDVTFKHVFMKRFSPSMSASFCFRLVLYFQFSQRAHDVYTTSYPAGTWRKYNFASTSVQRHDVAPTLGRRCIYMQCNVASTSMQRHDVASTLRRRCIYVMCPLGINVNATPRC